MKYSIRFKMAALLTTLLVFSIFITWFINRTFLSDFYLYSKVNKYPKYLTKFSESMVTVRIIFFYQKRIP